jgi:uncharacterized protein
MPRHKCSRTIQDLPNNTYYKPKGIPLSQLEEVVLTLDEYEAMRLADFDQLYQEHAADKMHISRQTFGRVIESAHYKIAEALIHGKAIIIEGGEVTVRNSKEFKCKSCTCAIRQRHVATGTTRCPKCFKSINHH